ncbi:MAG: sensor histidine kinase [Candidatus Nanopelagicales bacterium]
MPEAVVIPDDARTVVRREVLRFAIPGIIGILILAAASLAVAVAVARDQSMRDATLTAQWLARSVVEPRLSADLLAGKPSQIAALDQALAGTVEGSDVVGLRVWNDQGVVIYADDPRIIGEQFPVTDRSFDTTAPMTAEDADTGRPENRYLDPQARIVDVSMPVTGADGRTYLFEVHQLQDSVRDDARRVWLAFAPVIVGFLALVAILLFILGLRMARRISADLESRQQLMQHAIEATDLERRRIAAQLHDGTVQDLAGVSYTLAGLSVRARDDEDEARLLSEAAAQTRDAVRGLRGLLVDIYPPNLATTGLAAAIHDQAAPLEPRMFVDIDVADMELTPAVAAATYRIAREALANVAKHAYATQVRVTAHDDTGPVVLTVTDDGRGFDPGTVADGHLGLRISRDLAESVGGRLEIDSAAGTGATITFTGPEEER